MADYLKKLKCNDKMFPNIDAKSGPTMPLITSQTPILEALIGMIKTGHYFVPVSHPAKDEKKDIVQYWFSQLDAAAAAATLAKDGPIPAEFWRQPVSSVAHQTTANEFWSIEHDAKLIEAAKLFGEKQIHVVALREKREKKDKRPTLVGAISTIRLARVLLACASDGVVYKWNKTLRELDFIAKHGPVLVGYKTPASEAFAKMKEHNKRTVGVVEDETAELKVLVGMISGSDLTHLITDNLQEGIDPSVTLPAELALSVKDFLQWRDAAAGHEHHPHQLVYANASMTALEALRLMCGHDLHSLPLVTNKMEVVGEVTLNDIIQLFLPSQQEGKS